MSIHQLQSELEANLAFKSSGKIMETPEGFLMGWGTSVPSDGTTEYAPGATFIDTAGSVGEQNWVNEGSVTSAAFARVEPVGAVGGAAAASIRLPETATISFGATTLWTLSVSELGSWQFLPNTHDPGRTIAFGSGVLDADVQIFMGGLLNYARFNVGDSQMQFFGASLKVGNFNATTSGSGLDLSTMTAAMRAYADDGGNAIGSGSFVRAIVGRNLLTYTGGNREQEAGGVVGQVVSVAGTNRHNMAGTWGSYEARTSLTVGGQAAATDTWCQAGVLGRVGSQTASIITIDTNGVLAGVAAMSNVPTGFASNSGVFAAFYAGAWATAVDWAYAFYAEGGKFTTGIAIGSCITGLTITSASGYAIDIQTTGQLRMGIQGTGIPTATATPFVFELHAETGAVALTGGTTGLTCGLRCRYEVSVDQTNQISFEAIDARLRVKKDLADGNHCGVNGTIEASESGTVLSGTSTTVRSGGFFSLDFDANVSITSGWLCGVTIDSSVHGDVSMASCTFVGLYIKTSSSKELWETGIYIDTGSCVDGIYLGATTKACEMVVSALPANARGARFAFTCSAPAMTDGVGAHEIDLTVSAAATGQTCASSCWINAGDSATLTSGDYTFIHNDGVWLGNSATASGAIIAYARVQFIFGTNTSYANLHLFDLNLDIDQNMTSLINVNNLALTGFTAGVHSSGVTGSLPFIGTGGSVKYIRLYDTAA